VDRFEGFDSNCVILQLITVPAELFSAGYIFVAMVFKFFQNRIQFQCPTIMALAQKNAPAPRQPPFDSSRRSPI